MRYERTSSFEDAEVRAGIGFHDDAILVATTASQVDYEQSLVSLPDFFGPFFSMLALAASKSRGPLRVLDFGGATGDYHSYASNFFEDRLTYDWAVIETEMYAKLGRQFYLRRAFYTAVTEVPWRPNVAMFSGSLHCIKDWRSVLTSEVVQSSDTIFISRTAMGPEYIPFLQTVNYADHIVKYPGAVLARGEVEAALSKTHRLHASWALDHSMGELGTLTAPAMIWIRK